MPEFKGDNWTSRIKGLVKVHPDYESMKLWNGFEELADLEYHDTTGVFTKFMTEKGHLPRAQWEGKTPTYYFEVKSTPRACDAEFYMGGAQYQKARPAYISALCFSVLTSNLVSLGLTWVRFQMTTLCTDDKIYIIFRVFEMFEDKINCKLYVNPPELERQGKLEFLAQHVVQYAVRAHS